MTVLMEKAVNGSNVVWAIDGRVYFSRALHDSLPAHMQGRPLMCTTPREFEKLCAQVARSAA